MLAKRSNEDLLKPIILSILKDMGSTICDYKVDTLTFDITNGERDFLLTRMSEDEYHANFPGDKRTVQKLQFGYKVAEKEDTVWLPENLESEGTLEAIRLVIVLFDSIWRGTPYCHRRMCTELTSKGSGVYPILLLEVVGYRTGIYCLASFGPAEVG